MHLDVINHLLTKAFEKKTNFVVMSAQNSAPRVMADLMISSRPTTAVQNLFFEELYESAFPPVAGFVRQMDGSFQDAKDIFQDAMIIYLERTSEFKLNINVAPGRYILGIAKHLWLRKFKDDKRIVSLDDFEKALYIPVDFYPSIRSNRLLRVLELSGRKCMDLLRSFYFEKNALKDVARELGYGSEHSAAVQKYKCLEKIRESIKEKSITYEDFFE